MNPWHFFRFWIEISQNFSRYQNTFSKFAIYTSKREGWNSSHAKYFKIGSHFILWNFLSDASFILFHFLSFIKFCKMFIGWHKKRFSQAVHQLQSWFAPLSKEFCKTNQMGPFSKRLADIMCTLLPKNVFLKAKNLIPRTSNGHN